MYFLSIKATQDNSQKIQSLLYLHISWGWEEIDHCSFIVYFSKEKTALDFKHKIREISPDTVFELKPVQDRNWNEDWKKYFTPISIADTFIILPEWLENTRSSLTKIIITPKMAFGTGQHPTTSLCLKILASLYKNGMLSQDFRFIDLGTGTGILGIAGAKLGLSGIGIDIDPSAVDNARENIALNNVQKVFEVQTKEILTMQKDERFNLVFANILASTLRDFAGEIISLLDRNNYCLILSGILRKQVDDVARTYERLGSGPAQVEHEGEWSALVWTHNSGCRSGDRLGIIPAKQLPASTKMCAGGVQPGLRTAPGRQLSSRISSPDR